MPYVHESAPAPHIWCKHGYAGEYESLIPHGRSRTQYGYRSGRKAPQVVNAIDSGRNDTWATSKRIIRGLEYEYATRFDRQGFVVNNRDFVSHGHIAASADYTCSVRDRGAASDRLISSVMAVSAGVTGSSAIDYFPSRDWALSNASQMLRNSVPTAPAMDLLRSIGELKDAKLMFRLSNYRPSSVKEGGSAYLNQVFGVIPTLQDFQKLCESVLASDRIVRQILRNEDRQVRRTRTRSYKEGSFQGSFSLPTGATTHSLVLRDKGNAFGGITLYGPVHAYKPASSWVTPVGVFYRVDWKTVVRSFATFEYFVPRPTGIASRFEDYVLKAKYALGLELQPSTVYDLTAWTWLVNWAADISGLIRYQQAVADNQVVMNRSGFVREMVTTLSLGIYTRYPETSRVLHSSWTNGEASARRQIREPGGPYSLLQPWELSASQAAILTALGLSRWSPV